MKTSKCGHCGGTIRYGDFYFVEKDVLVPKPDIGQCDRCRKIVGIRKDSR